MKRLLAAVVSIFIVLTFAAPAFANFMMHGPEYRMDGIIEFKKQVGHKCNTGSVMKQEIYGEGEMTKISKIEMRRGYMDVEDVQEWITREDAIQNLTVISVIELCAPPKTVYNDHNGDHDGMTVPVEWLYGTQAAPGETFNVNGLEFNPDNFEALTDQVWAAWVEADPFFQAGLEQNFEAAYGPFAQHHGEQAIGVNPAETWWFVDADGEPVIDPHQNYGTIAGTDSGDYYVGNFFDMYQFARTFGGEVKRHIDISSPWSGAYIYEDMRVIGEAEIFEPFTMFNLPSGDEAFPLWWEGLF